MIEKFSDDLYQHRDSDATRVLYDTWAPSYDAEMADLDYAAPRRCAQALAQFAPDKSAPVLDFGCGTGLSGHALKDAGFSTVDGVDISGQMIAKAQSKSVYRTLEHIKPEGKLSTAYSLISAVGVIGIGAAPITTLDTLLLRLPRRGLVVFSLNDHSVADAHMTGRINEWLDCGAARLLLREHGDHLPGINMNAMTYVIEKM